MYIFWNFRIDGTFYMLGGGDFGLGDFGMGGSCPGGFWFGGILTGGILAGGILSRGDFVQGGFWLGGFCPGGGGCPGFFCQGGGGCPGGICPGGFCPRTRNEMFQCLYPQLQAPCPLILPTPPSHFTLLYASLICQCAYRLPAYTRFPNNKSFPG